MIKVLIADENEIASSGLATIIERGENCTVIGTASSFEQLASLGSNQAPDVVIIDYSGEQFGAEKIPVIKGYFPECKIIAITSPQPRAIIVKSLKTGANSYLMKSCSADEIVQAVEETARNKTFYCEKVLGLLSNEDGKMVEDEVSLSARELEIIKLIAQGFTNKEIAEKLYLSGHTVNTHRKNIMHKLGIKNTAGIVIYAVKENIVSA